jgi:hypothetical protein
MLMCCLLGESGDTAMVLSEGLSDQKCSAEMARVRRKIKFAATDLSSRTGQDENT